eukprot:10827956-Lingulodinium_polyedra.AAC.2
MSQGQVVLDTLQPGMPAHPPAFHSMGSAHPFKDSRSTSSMLAAQSIQHQWVSPSPWGLLAVSCHRVGREVVVGQAVVHSQCAATQELA